MESENRMVHFFGIMTVINGSRFINGVQAWVFEVAGRWTNDRLFRVMELFLVLLPVRSFYLVIFRFV